MRPHFAQFMTPSPFSVEQRGHFHPLAIPVAPSIDAVSPAEADLGAGSMGRAGSLR